MSVQGTGVTKALWLSMLSDGGYSTVRELSRAVEGKRVDRLLDQLAEGGYCQKVPRTTDHKLGVAFGVTPSCKVPQNVTVKDILEATKESK